SSSHLPLPVVIEAGCGRNLKSGKSMQVIVIACTSRQGPGPTTVNNSPPSDGPITLVKLCVAELSASSLTTPSCGTRVTTTTCCAAVLKELTIAIKITNTAMCQYCSHPEKTKKANSKQCSRLANLLRRSNLIRSMRSAITPPMGPKTKRGANSKNP